MGLAMIYIRLETEDNHVVHFLAHIKGIPKINVEQYNSQPNFARKFQQGTHSPFV